jgi:hypothetical protein
MISWLLTFSQETPNAKGMTEQHLETVHDSFFPNLFPCNYLPLSVSVE